MALLPNSAGLLVPDEATYDPFVAEDLAEQGDDSTAAILNAFPNPAAAAPRKAPAFVGINDATGKIRVNNFEFDVDDHRSAILSEQHLRDPISPLPEGFRPMAPDEYKTYLDQIDDPSFGRLISKNFGIGVDNLQLLAGRGFQLAGAEELGGEIVEQQIEDLSYNEPYQRVFTDIDSAGGAVDWFVSNLAQQGPNLIESALAAIVGAIVGGAAGGGPNPFTAIGGAMMALGSKEAVKQSILAIAKKKLRGEALEASEMKLLRETASGAVAFDVKGMAREVAKRGKSQGRLGGATSALFASNYAIGASDVYGEQMEAGTGNRGAALGLAVPYALMESIPELIGLGFFVRGIKGGLLKRGAKGFSAGFVGEGITEAGQESLLLTQNPEVDITSKEGIHRLINSFAAGAGVGGTIGTAGALLRKNRPVDVEEEKVDLLNRQLEGPETPLQITYQDPVIEGGPAYPQLTDQRIPGVPDPGTVLDGPGPVPLLEGPEDTGAPPVFDSDLPKEVFDETRRQQAGFDTRPIAAAAVDVAPIDDTQRDPGQIPIAVPPTEAQRDPDVAQEGRFLEAEAAQPAQPVQQELPLAPVNEEIPADFPTIDTIYPIPQPGFPPASVLPGAQGGFAGMAPAPRFINGEEAILDAATQEFVSVKQLLKKADQRVEANEKLIACLGRK